MKNKSKIILAGAIVASSFTAFNTVEANLYQAEDINTSKIQNLEILEACCTHHGEDLTDKEKKKLEKKQKKEHKKWDKEQQKKNTTAKK